MSFENFDRWFGESLSIEQLNKWRKKQRKKLNIDVDEPLICSKVLEKSVENRFQVDPHFNRIIILKCVICLNFAT